jgi:hypothetical protein
MMSSERFIVPSSYPELQRLYGSHIKKLLQRSNQVESNFEDLHSYVWVKILEARLLERFEAHLQKQTPKVLTAIGACDLLGVSWFQWVQAAKAYHTGKCRVWMPTPVNIADFRIRGVDWLTAKDACFAYEDVIALTWGEIIKGKLRYPFKVWGLDVKDGGIYGMSRPEGNAKIPEPRATQSQFKNYLTTAVLNHYANFCRTLKRRHKERPQALRGQEGDAIPWEDTLEEVRQAPPEVKIALSEARALLAETLQSCLVAFGVPPDGTAEERVFAQLQEGATLPQALRGAGFPIRVRKSVIRSIQLGGGLPADDVIESDEAAEG